MSRVYQRGECDKFFIKYKSLKKYYKYIIAYDLDYIFDGDSNTSIFFYINKTSVTDKGFSVLHKLVLASRIYTYLIDLIEDFLNIPDLREQITSRSYRDFTPLMLCYLDYNKCDPYVLDILIKYSTKEELEQSHNVYGPFINIIPLCYYVYTIRILKQVIDKGVNINSIDKFGKTPLMISTRYKSTNFSYVIVRTLLERGADINIVDQSEENVLHHFSYCYDNKYLFRIIKLLISYNVDINSKNKVGNNCLDIIVSDSTCTKDKYQIIRLIVNNGVEINNKDKNGYTPLDLIYLCNTDEEIKTKIMKFLISKGAISNVRNYAKYFSRIIG